MLIETIRLEMDTIKVQKILVGVSGGVDSMVLLYCLHHLHFDVVAVHINYGLRGAESIKDEQLVREFCGRNHIVFHCKKVESAKPTSNIQNWARDIRYSYYSEIELIENTDVTVIAHHRNDQYETILMNLIQGKSLPTLKGIPKINGKIFRPMLSIDRKEIEEFASKHNVSFRHDATNFETDYFRNIVRNQVLPELLSINPSFGKNVTKLQSLIHFLEEDVSKLVMHCYDEKLNLLLSDPFFRFSKKLQIAIFEKVLNINGQFDVSRKTILNGLRLIKSQTGKASKIGDLQVIRERNGLKLVVEKESEPPQLTDMEDVSLPDKNTTIAILNYVISHYSDFRFPNFLDDEIVFTTSSHTVSFRKWQAGDVMKPLGGLGGRKIKKILTDAKIGSATRKESFVIVDQNKEIIALIFPSSHPKFGLISDTVKLKGDESDVYRITEASFE